MAAFMGMRGNGDWVTDQRPKNWREMILFLYPNGDAPLTAIQSKMSQESTDDPEFNWWDKSLPVQGGTAANVFTDVGLTTAYVSGGAAGDVLYVQCAAAVASEFRQGHQVLLRDESDYSADTNAKVVDTPTQNGASSYIPVKLLQADPGSGSAAIAGVDRILVIGNVNPEGGAMPDALAYDPTKRTNYTQIFRNSLSITRTARKTKLRTGDQYQEDKRETLELHSIEMEKAFIWGYGTEGTGDNLKPERTTWGLIPYLSANGGLTNDFSSDTDYTDTSWLNGGEEWLDEQFEVIFRHGSRERLAFAGTGAVLGINKLIKEYGTYEFTPKTTSYGIKVMEWVTPFGTVNIMVHPLFSHETTNSNSMLIYEPKNVKYRFIDDTMFIPDPDKKNTGRNRIDGTDEEFLTEAGLEFHHPSTTGYLNGVGLDNGTP